MTILEQVLGSSQQIHVLRFFLFHPDEEFTIAQLQARIGRRYVGSGNPVRSLFRLGCLSEGRSEGATHPTYRMNTSWLLFPEFRALFVKAQLLVEHDVVRRLEQAGRVQLLILTGMFVGNRTGATDVLIVGTVNQKRVTRLLKSFERDLEQEVRYTILTPLEYRYRKNVGDRFLYDILEGRHLVVLDILERPRGAVKAAHLRKKTIKKKASRPKPRAQKKKARR